MASLHFHKIKHPQNSERKGGSLRDNAACELAGGLRGRFREEASRASPGEPSVPTHFFPPPRRPESDAESSEGLHQGDLRVRIGFTSVVVPVAAPAPQGFMTVPLLLSLLLLQALLLSPLSVCDLWELVFICLVFFTRAGPRLIVFSPAFI